MVVFGWCGCHEGIFWGCVYHGGAFPCVGEFDVVMCWGRFDRVGINVDIMYFLNDILEFLWVLCVFCGV